VRGLRACTHGWVRPQVAPGKLSASGRGALPFCPFRRCAGRPTIGACVMLAVPGSPRRLRVTIVAMHEDGGVRGCGASVGANGCSSLRLRGTTAVRPPLRAVTSLPARPRPPPCPPRLVPPQARVLPTLFPFVTLQPGQTEPPRPATRWTGGLHFRPCWASCQALSQGGTRSTRSPKHRRPSSRSRGRRAACLQPHFTFMTVPDPLRSRCAARSLLPSLGFGFLRATVSLLVTYPPSSYPPTGHCMPVEAQPPLTCALARNLFCTSAVV